MIPLSTTQLQPLKYDVKKEAFSQKMKAASNHIGWIHSIADKPGAKFDVVIKDGLGRTKKRFDNFGGETEKSGQLINLETMLGEDIQIEIENVRNAENITLFVN